MDDEKIVDLYWQRAEDAIAETKKKYAKYCYSVAYGILRNNEDSEECVNETYLRAWNAMPTARPERLSTFLGKIVRNLSLNRYEKYCAGKRGAGQVELAWAELEECIADNGATVDKNIESELIVHTLNSFLTKLKPTHRKIFVRRYWNLDSVEKIAKDYCVSTTNVKQILFRIREKLRLKLKEEGISL